MRALILDFETNGSDPKKAQITEIGAVLYDVRETDLGVKLFREKLFSSLCYAPNYPPQPEKIIEITGITDEMLQKNGMLPEIAFEQMLPLVEEADVVVAHKIAFDWVVFVENLRALGLGACVPKDKELLCTLTNFKWPSHLTCHKLGHLAWELGVDVKAKDLHRAVNDVELLAKVINLFDFKDVLAYAREPWQYLKADVLGPWSGRGGDGGVQVNIAKSLGFAWESVKGTDFPKWPKTWVTRVKKSQSDGLIKKVQESESPFRVSEVLGT